MGILPYIFLTINVLCNIINNNTDSGYIGGYRHNKDFLKLG